LIFNTKFSAASKIVRHVVFTASLIAGIEKECSIVKMRMSYGPSSTKETQCSKIKTALGLPACFDKILVTHHQNTTKKVTFTTDLPFNSTLFNVRRTETQERNEDILSTFT
jgi:hypothetical protein